MKFRVYGILYVAVSTVVEVPDDMTGEGADEAICEKAEEEFKGVKGLVGHGGYNKMVGVVNQKDTIAPCEGEGPEFTECERLD